MAKVSRSVPSSSSSATGGLSPSISMSGKMFARSSSYHPYRKSLGLPSSSRKSLHSRHQDFCAGCGVFTTPLWRRDSSGRRTLCNSCGLKWCFGMSGPWDASMGLLGGIAPGSALPSSNQRMNPGNASSTFLSKPFPSSPSTLPQDAHNGGKRQLMSDAASSSTAAIDLDGSSLDRSPASSSKLGGVRPNIPTADEEGNGEHQLRRLMEAVRREDAAADRAFRRAVVRFRRVRSLSSNAPTTTALQSSYLLDRGQPQADAAAPALRSVRRFSNDGGDDLEEMDAWSEDEQWGRESVMSFIHAVRGRREMPPE
ncbi:hypothetical protein DFJ73DRAFT_857605 [Zopfochytrium polystomum]|nr:hypothetical protein DFJ73DRAFT_857605 [Zopfochytrium polystomum]